MEPVIEIKHLTKSYGKNRGVIDVSLSVNRGEIYGFLGPNGAGKSTTIRSLMGLIRSDYETMTILGKDCVRDHKEIMREVGYMPSEAWFYPSMRVSEVIGYAAEVRGIKAGDKAGDLCERLKLDTTKRIRELSLGNRKKVSIVCAMQHSPKVLIFDEPTSGLDPLIQKRFFGLIAEAAEGGVACLLSTHVLSEVNRYCMRAAIMREGRLMVLDSPGIDEEAFIAYYEDGEEER